MSSTDNILLETALNYARAGYPVFPCLPYSKVPATKHGQNDETTDENQIIAWWTENPQYNVAFRPEAAGLCVVDIDPGGQEKWDALQDEVGPHPETYTVRTPRGGRHLYFTGSLPPTVGKAGSKRAIDEHVDTRGGGSYVLLPPSVTENGEYSLEKDIEIAPVPAWIAPRIEHSYRQVSAQVEDLDLPVNLERARRRLADLVEQNRVAVEGCGGDATTFQVACSILDLGLSKSTALDLIDEVWNPACQPPWPRDELEIKVANAERYMQNEAGAWASKPASETLKDSPVIRALLAEKPTKPKFYFEDEEEQDNAREPTWLIPNLLPDQSTVLFYGPTGTFKSFIALSIALGITCNRDTFGSPPGQSGPVFYGAHEGRHAIRGIRRRAWKSAHDVAGCGPFFVGRAPLVADPDEVQAFGDSIKARLKGELPRLIILDTVAKCMVGLNENDARDASRFIRFCDSLVEEFGCTVLAIAHTGKDAGKGARGSSAFPAGFDTIISAEGNRRDLTVDVKVIQHKDAEERDRPWHFKGRKHAGSLVFDLLSDEEYAAQKPVDPFSRVKIGQALRELRATGLDSCVTTRVLADHLVETTSTEPPETLEFRIKETVRLLNAKGRSQLAGYCAGHGRDIRWFLPTA